MPGAARDPRTGLPPRAAGELHDVPAVKPLHPRNIKRQTVYAQAAIRRFIHARRVMRGVTALAFPHGPPVATALFFCKYLRIDLEDTEDEAVCICAFICGREPGKGLKLGDCSDAFEEYEPLLKNKSHPALMMLLERFDEIVCDCEEEIMANMQEVSLPSEAEKKLRETMLAWRSPELRPGTAAPLFKQAREIIDKLRTEHEQVLIKRMPIINNQEAYGAMLAEVEREFVGARTILRGQLRSGRNQHRALLETEVSTMYGWPPTGPGPSLKRAGRKYVLELGKEHPLVEDFIDAARRHIKSKEDKCIEQMTGLEKEILRLRGLVNADPPAPKLMRDSYIEEMNEKCLEAMQNLTHWEQDIGKDSAVYMRFLKSTKDTPLFLESIEADIAETVKDLRALGARPAPSLETDEVAEARAIGATALTYYLEILDAESRQKQAAPLRAEFDSELKRVEDAVALFKDAVDEQEGWHKPPGWETVDQPLKPAEPPPPPPPPKKIKLERELPGMGDAEGLTMRLHGVGYEDVNRHHELLLLEMAADIIAEECKIPRDCIFNLAFADPAIAAAAEAKAAAAAAVVAAAEAAAAEAAEAAALAVELAAAQAQGTDPLAAGSSRTSIDPLAKTSVSSK